MRKRKLLLIVATLLILLMIGGFFFARSAYVLNKIRVALEDGLEKQLNHPVTIEQISGNALRQLDIEHFEIADKRPDQPSLITIEEFTVKYNLFGLMRRKFIITNLVCRSPEINAAIGKDGKLNLTKLIPPTETESSGKFPFRVFVSHIAVENGTIRFADEERKFNLRVGEMYSSFNGPPDRWAHTGSLEVHDGRFELDGVEKKIDEFKTQFEVRENEGSLKELRLASGNSVLVVSAEITNPRTKPLSVETHANLHLDLRDLEKFLPHKYQAEGQIQLDVEVSGNLSEITGQCTLRLPSGKLNQLQVENLGAKAEFTHEEFHLTNLQGIIASGKLTGGADVRFIRDDSTYSGWLQFDSLQAQQILPFIAELPSAETIGELSGKIQLSFSRQDLADLKLDGNLKLTESVLNNVPVEASELYCTIADDQLSLRANFDELRMQLNGALGLTGERDLNLGITEIDLGRFARILGIAGVGGTGTLTGTSTTDIPLIASLHIPDVALRGARLGVLTADVHYGNDGRLSIKPLKLAKGASELRLEGIVETNADLAATSENLPVDFKIHAQSLQIADFVGLAIADSESKPAPDIGGILGGKVALNGTLQDLQGQGEFEISNGHVGNWSLDPLTIPLEFKDSLLTIPALDISTGKQGGVFSAQVELSDMGGDFDPAYEFSFQSESMQLAKFLGARGITDYPLDANLIVKVTGKGTVSQPQANVSIDVLNPTWARIRAGAENEEISQFVALSNLHITGQYANNRISIKGVGFENQLQIAGQLDTNDQREYHLSAHAADWELTPIFRIFSDKLEGAIDGTLEVAGSLLDLQAFTLDLSIPTLSLNMNGQQLVNPSPITLSFADNLLRIDSFDIAHADDHRPFISIIDSEVRRVLPLSNSPHSEEKNTLTRVVDALEFNQFQIASDGFALERLAELLGLPSMISGTLRYTLEADGPFSAPQFSLVWSFPDLRINPELNDTDVASIEPITISELGGHLLYKDKRLVLRPIDFKILDNPAEISAHVPVDLSLSPITLADRLGESSLEISLESNDFALQSLNPFLPGGSQLDGVLDVTIHATGSVNQPTVSAAVDVTGAGIHATNLPQPIENLTMHFEAYSGDKSSNDLLRVDLKSAAWQFAGGEYSAVGAWHLVGNDEQPTFTSILNAISHLTTRTDDGGKTGVDTDIRINKHEPLSEYHLQIEGNRIDFAQLATDFMGGKSPISKSAIDLQLEIQGNGYTPDYVTATLTGDNLQLKVNQHELRNLNEMRLRFAERKLYIEPIQIGQDVPWFSTKGMIDLDGNLDCSLKLSELPLTLLLPAESASLLNAVVGVQGDLEGEIGLQGNFSAPIIDVEWQALAQVSTSASPQSETVKAVELAYRGNASYRDKLLSLRDVIQVDGKKSQMNMSGKIPIDLSFQEIELADRFLNSPINIQLQADDFDLSFFATFHPLLEEIGGTVDVDLRIQGTTVDPYPVGSLTLAGGWLKLVDFPRPISDGTINLKIDKGLMHFPAFSFRIGGGAYEAEISLQMAGLFPERLDVQKFSVTNAQIIDFISDKAVPELTASITAEARVSLPLSEFITPGETAWIPRVAELTPQILLTHVESNLSIKQVSVEGLGYHIRNDQPIEIRLDEQTLRLAEGFVLADANAKVDDAQRMKLTGFGIWELGEPVLFTMQMENFHLGFLSPFVPNAYSLGGTFNASLDVRGTGAKPEITLDWATSGFSINQGRVDEFTGRISYKDEKLNIGEEENPTYLAIGPNRAELSGLVPINFSLLDLKAKPSLENIETRLDVNIRDLDFLPLIFPQIGYAKGSGGMYLTIGGKLSSPELKGVATLDNLSLDMPESLITIQETHVNLDLTDQGLKIRRFDGRFNDGQYSVAGFIDWRQSPHINLSLVVPNGFIYDQPGLYKMEFQKVDLGIQGPIVKGETLKLPPISGSILIAEGKYEQHWQKLMKTFFDKQSAVQTEIAFDAPIVRDLTLDLALIAPITPDKMTIISELGNLNLEVSVLGKIVGPIQRPIFTGRVDLLAGEFSFVVFKSPFTITEGSYVQNRSSVEFNPYYEVHARTTEPIPDVWLTTTNDERQMRDVQVTMDMKGNLNDRQTFANFEAEIVGTGANEEYALTQPEIWSILVLGRVDPSLSETLATSDTSLSALALGQGEQYFGGHIARLFGLSVAQLKLNTDAFEKSQFQITRRILKRLSVTYASTFDLHGEPRLGVEYQINNNIAVKGERSEGGKYGVDLKLERKF